MSDFNVQIGSVFAGDFRIDRALSAGGMGAVYVAEQLSTGKHRALKVMLSSLVADPALRKRFEQEARIGSLIESEHVVEVVGAGIDAGTGLPWLAMELLSGEDLDKVVTTRGALPVPEVLALFEQLCHAVGAAHKVGVVHRDLKPENIFLARSHRAGATSIVKVLDFGIAKIVAEASTKQTAAMGSPIWMAPEQADQSPITPGTDVWALGLIAFFLLTGRPYWKCAIDESATIPQVLKEVLFEPIVPASMRIAERGASLPPGFDAWFAQCVAREPHRRFADGAQAGAALAAALGGAAAASGVAFAATMPPMNAGVGITGPAAAMGAAAFAGTGPVGSVVPGTQPAGGARGTGPSLGGPSLGGTGVSGSYSIEPAHPSAPPVAPKKSGAAFGIVFTVLLLGGLAAGGFFFLRHRGTTVATAQPAVVTSAAPAATPAAAASPANDDTHAADSTGADAAVVHTNLSQAALHQTTGHRQQSTFQDTPPVAIQVAPTVAPPPLAPTAPPPTAPPPRPEDLAASSAPGDWWVARRMLEPKVTAGSATVAEVRLLVSICKKQRDKPCVKMAERALAGKH